MKHIGSTMAVALLLGKQAYADQGIPACLSICTMNSANPCTTDSLPALISCLTAECASNSALSRFAVSYTPKIEYSCEQTNVPSYDTPSANLTMSGLGRCTNSPYDFQSFISDSGNDSSIANLCHMSLYPKEDCVGEVTTVKLDGSYNQCHFQGGRSARLDCSPASDSSAALRYAQRLCSNYTTSDNSTSTSGSTLPLSTSAGTSWPNSTFTTPSTSSNASSTETLTPYTGAASDRKETDASIAALFALVAAFVML